MSTHPLFDKVFSGAPAPTGPPLSGEELKKRGMESAVSHTPDGYRDEFVAVVKKFPRGHLFTVEDVRKIIGDPPDGTHYNCMGGLMRTAAVAKLITRTAERRKAKRASLHASEIAVWRRI